MIAVNMPQVGQDIPTARIVEWTKREGDPVRKGEVMAVVESDKATFEVEAPQDGILVKIAVPAGEEGKVFEPIAWLGHREETVPPASPLGKSSETTVELSPVAPTPEPGESHPRLHPPSSPSARRLAREHGVDLGTLRGTGPGGRIVREDVLAAVAARATRPPEPPTPLPSVPPARISASPESDEVIPFSRMRQRIAERLVRSKQTIPHFHLIVEVDMTEAQLWRQFRNANGGDHFTVTDLLLFATARTLVEFPRLNAHVESDRLIVPRHVHLGLATAVEDGLLVPVIPEAENKSLEEISRLARQIAAAARRGVVAPSVPSTFTLSSLGPFGVTLFLPIINPPECALLAVGAIQPRVVPIAGGLGVRQVMSLTLACDHRAVDGAYAARFLARLKERLETGWRANVAENAAAT